MSEAEAEGQEKVEIYKLEIGKMVVVVIVSLLMIAILWPGFAYLREYRRRSRCGENIERLGKAMMMTACDYDDKYPPPDKWCDLLIKYAEVTEKELVCPSAGEGRCHYAMNPNATLLGPVDIVVLFETMRGWNQFGGPEILTFENHKGKGCNVLINDFSVEFVTSEQIGGLRWKDKRKE